MRIFKSNNRATQFTFINNFIFTFLFKLKSIGFDHAINYKKERLRKEDRKKQLVAEKNSESESESEIDRQTGRKRYSLN